MTLNQLGGLKGLPYILNDDATTPLKERNLHQYEQGIDNLHNVKGHLKRLLGLFSKEPNWNATLFQNLLMEYISFLPDHPPKNESREPIGWKAGILAKRLEGKQLGELSGSKGIFL